MAPRASLLLLCAAVLAAADYPRWRGDGAGSAGACAVPLVDSWADARIRWVSEAKSPHPWNYSVVRGKTQWPRTVLGNGGYCHPALAGGRIYVMYWRPAGKVTAASGPGKYVNKWAKSGIEALSLIDADACIVCLDAATGRTLWETVYAGTELNHVELYGGHNNVCVADGRVFAIGGTGLIYAVDAATGDKLWRAELGSSAALWRWFKAHCLAERIKSSKPPAAIPEGAVVPPPPPDGPPHPRGGSLNNATYNICPTVVDGAVVTGEWARSAAIVAFDAASGEELWRARGISGIATPLPWPPRAVILPGARGIKAVEARTGRVLWGLADVSGATSSAVSGDVLVAEAKGERHKKATKWAAFRITEEGAEPLWALAEDYRPAGYLAAVVHQGRAWLPFTRDARAATGCATVRGRMGIVGVGLANGEILGEVTGITYNGCCPGPLAMGDRFLYQHDRGLEMVLLDPASPRYLGGTRQHSNYCSSLTAADGLVYFRSGERLVVCLDLRREDPRAPLARHDDPARARYELTLPGLRIDGKDVRLVMRGREGRFPQAWLQTLAPGYGYPDVIDAGDFRVADGRLRGRGRAIIEGATYDLELDLVVRDDGSVAGSYRDTLAGVPVEGAATGGIARPAGGKCTLRIHLPRHFFNGQNQSQEPVVQVGIEDGAVRTLKMVPRKGGDAFTATVLGHELAWRDRRLTGPIDFDVVSRSEITAGRYRLVFTAEVRHNLVWGSFTSQRRGAEPTRHGIFTYPPYSPAEIPAELPATLADAVLTIDLPRAVVSTMGRFPLRLHLSHGPGGCSGVATTSTVGLHRIDTSGLVVGDERITGTVRVDISADGYALRSATRNEYRLDLRLEGKELKGGFTGLADRREPRQGEVTGRWFNED